MLFYHPSIWSLLMTKPVLNYSLMKDIWIKMKTIHPPVFEVSIKIRQQIQTLEKQMRRCFKWAESPDEAFALCGQAHEYWAHNYLYYSSERGCLHPSILNRAHALWSVMATLRLPPCSAWVHLLAHIMQKCNV